MFNKLWIPVTAFTETALSEYKIQTKCAIKRHKIIDGHTRRTRLIWIYAHTKYIVIYMHNDVIERRNIDTEGNCSSTFERELANMPPCAVDAVENYVLSQWDAFVEAAHLYSE